MTRFLLTGATGFVGVPLARRLLRDGHDLAAAVLEGEEGLLPEGVTPFTLPPLCAASDYRRALEGREVVVHLAARVHVMRDTAANPIEEFRQVNLHGTERLARQAAEAGVRRFVQVSTVKVLGEESPRPYREEDPLRPHDPYGTSKAEAEAALARVAAETGLEVVVVRPPLVYGPGVKANFLRLLGVVRRGIPLPLGSVKNRRSLVYVENLVDALATAALHPHAAGQTFLVSDGEDLSTAELVRRVAGSLGMPARLVPVPEPVLRMVGKAVGKSAAVERLVGSLQLDSTKIRRELGWHPPFTLDEGVAATADWFKREG